MCWMIAVGVPPGKMDDVRQALAYDLLAAPQYVTASFERGVSSFLVDVGHCACSFFSDPMSPAEAERLRLKYAKKGWKADRIARVLAERQQLGGLDLGLLQNVVRAAKDVGKLSLLVYWDDGATIPNGSVVQVRADELISQRSVVRASSRVDIT